MAISRLFNFLSGTTISSSQVNAEFNQLVTTMNQVQSDDNAKDTALRGITQLSKITSDNGGVKLNVSDTSKNLLNELANLGNGLHTFYCITGATNNPANAKSVRGIFHQTSTGFGWVYCQDSNGDSYENYYDNNTWKGWKSTAQPVLWSGSYYPNGSTTITPSKKLSQCNNGWILVWSDFDTPNTPNDFDWHYTYIPKNLIAMNNGQGHLWAVPKTPSTTIVKRGNVYDDKLVGHDDNTLNGGDDVVLRYILEW